MGVQRVVHVFKVPVGGVGLSCAGFCSYFSVGPARVFCAVHLSFSRLLPLTLLVVPSFVHCSFVGRALGFVAVCSACVNRHGCGSAPAFFFERQRKSMYRRGLGLLFFVMGWRRKEDGSVVTWGLCVS